MLRGPKKIGSAQDNKWVVHGVTIVENLDIKKIRVGICTESHLIGNRDITLEITLGKL